MCPYLILEETFIGLLDPLREVGKEGKARHRCRELHDILDLDVLTLGCRWRCSLDDGEHDLVELVCGNPLTTSLVDLLYLLEDFEDTLFSQSRDKNNGEVRKGSESLANSSLKGLNHRIAFLLYQIPLIDADNESLAVLLNE